MTKDNQSIVIRTKAPPPCGVFYVCECPLMAGDCLLQFTRERPLSRKLTLKLDASAAIDDPKTLLRYLAEGPKYARRPC